MTQQEKRKKGMTYLFFAVALISVLSFMYLNLCADNNIMLTQYFQDLSYNKFNVDQIVLPDLQFFESGIQRIMDLILAKV